MGVTKTRTGPDRTGHLTKKGTGPEYYYYLLLTSNLEKFYIYNDFCKNIN
jgi:hypothetical protein